VPRYKGKFLGLLEFPITAGQRQDLGKFRPSNVLPYTSEIPKPPKRESLDMCHMSNRAFYFVVPFNQRVRLMRCPPNSPVTWPMTTASWKHCGLLALSGCCINSCNSAFSLPRQWDGADVRMMRRRRYAGVETSIGIRRWCSAVHRCVRLRDEQTEFVCNPLHHMQPA
jgi:hypothetical protein